jgi:hypothetical protein
MDYILEYQANPEFQLFETLLEAYSLFPDQLDRML